MTLTQHLVAPCVTMITAPNPGVKTLQGTNCYLIGQHESILLDAGPDIPAFLEALAEFGRRRITAILLTHDHPDHAGGAERLSSALQVPVWMNGVGTEPGVRRGIANVRALHDGQEFRIGEKILQALACPGHSPDHFCFLLRPDGILFTGDAVLGQGSTLIAPPEGNLVDYMATLERLRALRPSSIAPGHGPLVLDPDAKIDEYITHRKERESELLRSLTQPASIAEMVDRVYEPSGPDMRRLAELSVEAQMIKLQAEGKIQRSEAGDYRIRALS